MPALNFKKQFAPMVEAKVKRQTIRPSRKNPFRQGDSLYLYTGMRTKQCRKLGEATCTEVREVRMTESGMKLDGVAMSARHIDEFARDDGFHGVEDFREFFRSQYGFPFHGQLIKW